MAKNAYKMQSAKVDRPWSELLNSVLAASAAQKLDLLSEFLKALQQPDLTIFTRLQPNSSNFTHAVITVSDCGGLAGVSPLIDHLLQDQECARLSVVCRGPALERLKKDKRLTSFERIEPGEILENTQAATRNMIKFEMLRALQPTHLIVTTESDPGPQILALLASEQLFGCDQIHLIVEDYESLGGSFLRCGSALSEEIHNIKRVLCNDHIALALSRKTLPNLGAHTFCVTGTGQLTSAEPYKAEQHFEQGRTKLGLDGTEKSFLFLGDISSYSAPVDPKINEITWQKTLETIIEIANVNPCEKYVLVLRPHPGDPNKAELYQITKSARIPANLRVIDGGDNNALNLHFNEACYAVSMVLTCTRTEALKSLLRGKRVGLLYLEEPGLGATLFETKMNELIRREFAKQTGFNYIRNIKRDLSLIVANLSHEDCTPKPPTSLIPHDVGSNMAKVIFARLSLVD